MRAAAVLTLIVVLGCQSESFERYHAKEQQVSILALEGWTTKRQHGALVFVGPADKKLSRVTIAVKSADLPMVDAPDETPADVALQATQYLIERLPEAEVLDRTALRRQGYRGLAFSVRFVPQGRSETYERRHVVLVGRRVIHLMHTAPSGQLAASAELFDDVVKSMREEA